MRLLIDECLSPALVEVAHRAGFEAYHVAHRGWSGKTDAAILIVLNEVRTMPSLINKVVAIGADGGISVSDLPSA